jgi:sulfopyruvate decarboxylase alpha subunit
MIWTDIVFDRLKENNLEVVCHVPDIVLASLIARAEADSFFTVVPLTREEEGVGVLTGAYLGGRRGLLMMQVSGLGNSINGLASLAIPYQIPFLMLISQRGELGEFNPAQIAMGQAARPMLDALGIQHFTLRRTDEMSSLMDGAIKTAYTAQRPVALFLSTEMVGWKQEK